MAARRSVRFFSSEPVAFELVENAIRCASLAPSDANQQPWKFVVVKDAGIKRQIREAAEEEERDSYEHRMPADWLEELALLGTNWHKEFLETAPYLIVVFRIDFGLSRTAESETKHVYHRVRCLPPRSVLDLRHTTIDANFAAVHEGRVVGGEK
jgi:nitroreductase